MFDDDFAYIFSHERDIGGKLQPTFPVGCITFFGAAKDDPAGTSFHLIPFLGTRARISLECYNEAKSVDNYARP